MEKLKTWLDDALNNTALILDIKTALYLIISISLPMLYYLYSENFSLSGLLASSFGALLLLVIIGNMIAWVEIGNKAVRDEKDNNTELTELEDSTRLKQAPLHNEIDDLIIYNNELNKSKQHTRNIEKTQKRIDILQNKIIAKKIANKDYTKLEYEIERLKKNPLHDKSFKPYRIKSILHIEKSITNDLDGDKSININPATYGWRSYIARLPFKGISIGGSGMFILAFNDDGWTVFTFYLLYITTLLIMVLMRYPRVREITRTLYKTALDNINTYIDNYSEWKTKRITLHVTKEDGAVVIKKESE